MSIALLLDQADQSLHEGRVEEAVALYEQTIALDPSSKRAICSLVSSLCETGAAQRAVSIVEQAMDAFPGDAAMLGLVGTVYAEVGRTEEALATYDRALQLNTTLPHLHHQRALLLWEQGWPRKALAAVEDAMMICFDYVPVHHLRGVLLLELGQLHEAARAFRQVTMSEPDNEVALRDLVTCSIQLEQYEDAQQGIEQLFRLGNSNGIAHEFQGVVHLHMGDNERAIGSFTESLSLDSTRGAAWFKLGLSYFGKGDLERAQRAFQATIEREPSQTRGWFELGRTVTLLGQWEQAEVAYRHVLSMKEDHVGALAGLIQVLNWQCKWSDLPSVVAVFLGRLDQGQEDVPADGIPLLLHLSVCDDPKKNLVFARAESARIERFARTRGSQFEHARRGRQNGRLRVGYVSNDCRDHPMAHLLAHFLESHNRDRIEVWMYSHGPDDGSAYRQRIQSGVDVFLDVADLSEAELAQRIYDDAIDVLIDLMGHTRGARLEALMYRPAPIQLSWLGYPGTTGSNAFDGMIVDRIVAPVEDAACFSERLVYLPHAYQPTDPTMAVGLEDVSRSSQGLPEQGIVFCCFCRADKLDPLMYAGWMEILRHLPDSVLWLYVTTQNTRINLMNEAKRLGIDASRIVFAHRLTKEKHLQRLKLADIALDTRLYNGHTTTSDALWAGVPVITLLGKHFPSRVSASLLTAHGVPELIVRSLRDYVQLAIALGSDRDAWKRTRDRVLHGRTQGHLFNMQDFVLHFERTIGELFDEWSQGIKTES